ncbi:hypothetical protein BH09PAT1_BH09PAT1_5440 [soil metagenome]
MKNEPRVSFFRPTLFFSIFYLIVIFCLFLYSFTQIDLGLTMTRASIFTQIQKSFQYIGYFNRPLSTTLVVLLLVFLFAFYIFYILSARKKLLTTKTFWITTIILTVILTFSYTAFSYDIFNYIFDAKIFTHYHANPYLHKALDYPGDPMLSFMHWTQRAYPYGPVWLGLTIPLSYLGLNYFIPTFFIFKLISAVSYLGCIWIIGKIMRKVQPSKEVLAMVIFAFNPLVIIESLLSGHNDIVMMFFALVSLFFLINKKYALAFVLLFVSIGIKYATGFLLPMYIMIYFFDKKKVMIPWMTVFATMVVAMLFAVIAATLRTTLQPWYILFALPFAALLTDSLIFLVPSIIISLVFLCNYLPFLYMGNWDPPIPTLLLTINSVGIFLSLIFVGVYFFRRKKMISSSK